MKKLVTIESTKDLVRELSQTQAGVYAQQSMAKYQALFDSNMMGVAITDFKEVILNANDAFLSIIGYTRKDLASGTLTWTAITPKKYDGADLEKITELMVNKTIIPFEKEYIHKKGHVVPVLVGGELIDPRLSIGVCFALDISKIKEAEQKKDDFIGMVSHELKTPLSIMKLYTDYLKNSIHEAASKEELLESANEINNQIDKLNILITDLLNMARYEAVGTTIPVNAINLSHHMEKLVIDLSLVSKRNLVFEAEKSVYVNGNIERLSQVVTNLVNNSLRYSSPETDVSVKIYKKGNKAYLDVQDRGMGISKKDTAKIFERYYRINHADDYSDTGAGIGLFICSEIVKSHGGSITVLSEVGKGSTFSIELPLIK